MYNLADIFRYGVSEIYYCERVKEIYKSGMLDRKPKVYIRTYGCQQNVSDSEKYSGIFLQMGFDITENPENADVILFNTCAIRENAENKAFGNLGWIKSLKDNNKNLFVIVCGCMTEQKIILDKIKLKYKFIDLVFGTNSINDFPKLFFESLEKKQKNSKDVIYIENKNDIIFEDTPLKRDNRLKAFISIMYGCNNFCSYCIVPYVRGRERSRNSNDIIREFKELLNAGYKDITLLGQNVNSYGKGLEEEMNFPKLLQKLDSFGGEYRIRFMTSHPKDATNELFDVISKSKHIVHHIHLPVQSGSNNILSKMNRKYTKESYLKIIDYARKKIPDISFTSDIIVGFPNETYEEFLETIDLIKRVEFSSLFTFIYSKREGTPAAKMPDDVTKEEKTKRILELLEIQKEISENLCKNMVGKELRVLAESFDEKLQKLLCRTSSNTIVETNGDKKLIGSFLNVKIVDSKKESLIGILI